MFELIFGTYGVICWLVFKKYKLIPINQWTIVTAVLFGVFIMAFLLIMMNMFQPMTKDARIYAQTTPIVPRVKGIVTEVPVQANVLLSKGDILFKLDDTAFKNKVLSLEAKLKLANAELKRAKTLLTRQIGKAVDVESKQARVDDLTAQLNDAKFNLDSTIVRAPTAGFVTQVRLQPGMMAVPLPLAPVITFIHSDKTFFAATFNQNAMQGIDPGDEIEIAFNSIPGRAFKGKVKMVLPMMGEGQLTPSGQLLRIPGPSRPGRVPVIMDIESDISSYNLPIGSSAMVTVYTGEFKITNVVRRVIIRIKSWENYVFLP